MKNTKKPVLILALVLLNIVIIMALCSCNNAQPTNNILNACKHQWVNADCTFPKTCRLCGETEGEPLGHNWEEATCTSAKVCTVCNKTEGEAKEHNYVSAVLAPSCTEIGYTTYTCACGDTYKDSEISALGHTEVIDKAVAPTCTETGLTEGKHCSLCNKVLTSQKIVNALGHTEVVDSALNPTCDTKGLTEGKHCSVCNKITIQQVELPVMGHTWQSATCTLPKTCIICNEKQGAPLGHTEVIDTAIEPTTTSTGLTEGKHCSVCHIILVEQIVIPQKPSPSETSSFQIKKNDILKTYSSLYDYNEYSIDYVGIDKKDTSDSEFQITVTIGVTMLLIPEDVDYVPDYIKGYWELIKDGETINWSIFTISSVEELEYREVSFTCKSLETGDYTLYFRSYI